MKHITYLLACLMLLAFTGNAFAADYPAGVSPRTLRKLMRSPAKASALSSVCKSTFTLRSGQGLIKSQISHHIPSGDARAAGYTFICGSICASFPATIYYSDGTQAARVGYYGTYHGNGKPRAYCAAGGAAPCSVSTVSSNARRKRTGASLYLKINSRQCIQFNGSPGARNGGV